MHDLTAALLMLAGALAAATLFAAFTVSAEAGLARLEEKFPRATPRLRAWTPRWDLLRAALRLAAVLLEIAAILRLGRLGADAAPGVRAAVWAVGAAGFVLLLRVLPQILSESYADRLSVGTLPIAAGLGLVLAPLAWPLAVLERRLRQALLAGAGAHDRPSPEDAIISLVDQAPEEHLEAEEREIIRSVFEFGTTVAREIMTPRVRMSALEASTRVADALDLVRASGYSRYPVYEGGVDRVVGVVHARDLLLAAADDGSETPVRTLMQQPLFVPETMPISDLLNLLRARRQHLAPVVDEYGGTAGLVTMEDILEELIGEIRDETDDDETDLAPPAGDSGIFDASLPVDEVNETLGLRIPDASHYDSLGGYLVSELGRIPTAGAAIEKPGFRMVVEEANERQVLRVRIERAPGADGPPA